MPTDPYSHLFSQGISNSQPGGVRPSPLTYTQRSSGSSSLLPSFSSFARSSSISRPPPSTPSTAGGTGHHPSSSPTLSPSSTTVSNGLHVESTSNNANLVHLRRFAQLIGGRVGVDGEMPPRYSQAISGELDISAYESVRADGGPEALQ